MTAPLWVRSAKGLWHIERAMTSGLWSSAICGRNVQPTQRHRGLVAPSAECQRCVKRWEADHG